MFVFKRIKVWVWFGWYKWIYNGDNKFILGKKENEFRNRKVVIDFKNGFVFCDGLFIYYIYLIILVIKIERVIKEGVSELFCFRICGFLRDIYIMIGEYFFWEF